METKEIFKDIPGFEGRYEVSNMGRVRSLDRTIIDSRGVERYYRGRVLKGSISKGYRRFGLRVNGEGITLRASQLVAMAFLGHIPDGFNKVIDHIDGNKLNDKLSNLRIVSHRENLSNVCFRKDKDSLSSKHTGVSWSKQAKKWQAQILFEDKNIHLGLYDNELEASNAYQKALAKVKDNTFNPDEYKPVYTSRYTGVGFHKKTNKWQSRVRINGKQKHVGIYPTEIEAYNALQKFKKDNNFLIDKET